MAGAVPPGEPHARPRATLPSPRDRTVPTAVAALVTSVVRPRTEEVPI